MDGITIDWNVTQIALETAGDIALLQNVTTLNFATVGAPGPAGTPGAGGDSIARTKTAIATLSGHRIVRDVVGGIDYVDASVLSQADSVLGMTTGAIASGQQGQVTIEGEITEPSWAWTPDAPVYLTGLGLLTQVAPTSPTVAFLMQVGYAITATTMRIHIGPYVAL